MATLILLLFLLISYVVNGLTFDNVYVMVDPSSSEGEPILYLLDHWSDEQQDIGYLNDYIYRLYIKGKTSNSWNRMYDNIYDNSYRINTDKDGFNSIWITPDSFNQNK